MHIQTFCSNASDESATHAMGQGRMYNTSESRARTAGSSVYAREYMITKTNGRSPGRQRAPRALKRHLYLTLRSDRKNIPSRISSAVTIWSICHHLVRYPKQHALSYRVIWFYDDCTRILRECFTSDFSTRIGRYNVTFPRDSL